jgi:hypothetical protein
MSKLYSLPLLLIAALTPALAQTYTLWGYQNNQNTQSVAFWYLGMNSSGSNITYCCPGMTNLYYAYTWLYLPSTVSSPAFSSSPSNSWAVDPNSRSSPDGNGNVHYTINATNPPTANSESVYYTYNGSQSATVSVYVNAPHSMTSSATALSGCVSGAPPGWAIENDHSIQDRLGYTLVPIDTYETLENFKTIYAGQDWPENTYWLDWGTWEGQYANKNSEQWNSSTNTFPDYYEMCGSSYSPTPQSVDLGDPSPTLVYTMTQKFFVGSIDLTFDAVCALLQGVEFDLDEGVPMSGTVTTPVAASSCTQGSGFKN